jgi:hypothetical protein
MIARPTQIRERCTADFQNPRGLRYVQAERFDDLGVLIRLRVS